VPVVRWALEAARRHGVPTVLNPAPVQELSDELLGLVTYLTPNEGEAERLTGIAVQDLRSAAAAGRALRRRGVGTVIVTLGAAGALACTGEGDGERVMRAPAHAVTVVDTTAAGDAFNGALAVALGGTPRLEDALRFANAAAALACTRRGAQPSLPTRAEVDGLLRASERGDLL